MPGKVNIRSYALAVSVLLHLLILMLIQFDRGLIFSQKSEALKKKEDRLVFELVETPSNVKQEKPETESSLFSDKNLRAADPTENDLTEKELPFQEGEARFQQFQEKPAEILSEIKQKQKSFLETFQATQELQKSQSVDHENLLSQVKNQGGMSLNTYKWEFAPYLLEMKRKVQAHNNPPFAFTHLGAIDGDILLRFKVLQDGSVKDLEILSSNAHYSLEATSTRAIQFSSPFKPLPANFPKDYLEITALFSYIISGKGGK